MRPAVLLFCCYHTHEQDEGGHTDEELSTGNTVSVAVCLHVTFFRGRKRRESTQGRGSGCVSVSSL